MLRVVINDITDVSEEYIFVQPVLQVLKKPDRFSHVSAQPVSQQRTQFPQQDKALYCFRKINLQQCLSDSLLADFSDAQDVGEESFFVSVNKVLTEFSWLHEMVSQDTQGTQVRHFWRQNLEHALDTQTQKQIMDIHLDFLCG